MSKAEAIAGPVPACAADLAQALQAPRIVISRVSPLVEAGAFPAKAVVGQPVTVSADIFMDGHDRLAAELLCKEPRARHWQRVRMTADGNDRWQARFVPQFCGLHSLSIEAWRDSWGSYVDELTKKRAAGQITGADLEDGRQLIRDAAFRTGGPAVEILFGLLDEQDESRLIARLLAGDVAAVMAAADEREFLVRLQPEVGVDVERRAAGWASWYELFPRSQTRDPARPGTFDDVIGRLPAIEAMGFDVLYFPPIHPIGRRNRKGRNNQPQAQPGDVGSPYAIGSHEGGHDAVHPELGGMEAFRRLLAAAAERGIEIALDFAVQCAPDHPWLEKRADWFTRRADGSIRHAENPPKKYEDIVNVDFYAQGAQPDLWLALRDICEFWIGEGVRIFRVDNPHTKPLPFWQWLIGDIRSRHPDVIFLAEAFTRPAMMYRLAQIGFSQSYTYFTWRHGKSELTEYLSELTRGPAKDFFRPHFFVNTPDINPLFLQTSGRPGFLIRAALAATLSGLWGIYSGFELCEADALPGREEYLDSEKYEIKPRDWQAPGNIIREIARLNHIRRANPALHSHLNLKFRQADSEQVLYYSKFSPEHASYILAAVCLDPHRPHHTLFDLPLEELGVAPGQPLEAEELMRGTRLTWHGRRQHWYFNAEMPFAIWRLQVPAGAGA